MHVPIVIVAEEVCASRVLAVQPARLAWCHGKLYVANAYATGDGGRGIHEYVFDSSYEVLEKRLVMETPQPFPPSNEKMAWSILGLACDPRDDDHTFKLYFTLSPLYTQVRCTVPDLVWSQVLLHSVRASGEYLGCCLALSNLCLCSTCKFQSISRLCNATVRP